MSYHFVAKVVPPPLIEEQSLWFIFNQEAVLLQKSEQSFHVPLSGTVGELGIYPLSRHYLGTLNGTHCFCAEISDNVLVDPRFQFYHLRKVHELLGEALFNIASRALQILRWDRTHQFCGHCGQPLLIKNNERAKYCPHCNTLYYPKLSPSIIVAITRDDEILLARSPHFKPGNYSVLAGFIEPGETAEETLMREVMEEVGIEVKNIQYVGSQSWPFPNSFMLAFTAEYASGEITVDGKEIEDARWFQIDHLPQLPSSISIARSLIENFIKMRRGKTGSQ